MCSFTPIGRWRCWQCGAPAPHNEGVGLIDNPQVWTLIGVFTTIMLGGMTLMTTLLGRSINGLRGEMTARFETVDARFDALRGEMNARFDTVNTKIEHLDRDVTTLMRRAWGEPSAD